MPRKPNPHKMLREARIKAGLSQVELAAKVGVGKQAVCNWERYGRRPAAKHMLALKPFVPVEAWL